MKVVNFSGALELIKHRHRAQLRLGEMKYNLHSPRGYRQMQYDREAAQTSPEDRGRFLLRQRLWDYRSTQRLLRWPQLRDEARDRFRFEAHVRRDAVRRSAQVLRAFKEPYRAELMSLFQPARRQRGSLMNSLLAQARKGGTIRKP